MSANDLTNLYFVKTWLGIAVADTTMDAVLSDIISGVSDDIRTEVSRDIFPVNSYSKVLDGNGKSVLFLPNYPIVSITSLSIGSAQIGAATYPGTGYLLDGTKIRLSGYCFDKGIGNVALTYQAGFAILNEPQSVPASGGLTITPAAPKGPWGQDLGVSYALGGDLTLITGAPGVGQYAIATSTTTNITTYTFNAADAGKAMLLSYGYVPKAINRAATEWVAFRYAFKQRIGQKSHSVGGDNTTFDTDSMPDGVAEIIASFDRVFAIR